MRRHGTLLVVLLATVLAACAAPVDHETFRRHEDDHHHADGELLVLNPPKEYLAELPAMGLTIHEVTELPALGSKLYHVRISDDRHPFVAREHHEQRFPDVKVDLHHHFTHHASPKKPVDKSYTARGATSWQKAGRACGSGMRIGVIDGHVDVRHAAFKGLKIKHRAFNAKGTRLPDGHHGTA
jgi:hypothetical protein